MLKPFTMLGHHSILSLDSFIVQSGPCAAPHNLSRKPKMGTRRNTHLILLPNGMVGHLHGPEVGHHNDNHLLAESGLLRWCKQNAFCPGMDETMPAAQQCLQVFGDPAYGIGNYIMSPFTGVDECTPEQQKWNEAMAKVCIKVEHGFGNIIQLWPFLNTWWKQCVYSSPLGIYYGIACLLTNAHNCIQLNQTAYTLHCYPPTLEEYFQDVE